MQPDDDDDDDDDEWGANASLQPSLMWDVKGLSLDNPSQHALL